MDYSLITSILLITSSAQAETLTCSPVGSLRCQLEALDRLGARQVPTNSTREAKAKIDPRRSSQPSRVYAITAERRAFLNLIRYLVLTWDEGNDSGYLAQGIAQAEAIGAYQITTKAYEQALLDLWGSKRNKQNESVAPVVQDQVALYLVDKSGALTQIDKAFAGEEEMNAAIAAVASLFPVQASKVNKAKTTLAGVSAFSFYSTNISGLKLSSELVTTVHFGDTVVKIAQHYGLTLQELLRLNPGMETARLVVGSQVRLRQASSERTRIAPHQPLSEPLRPELPSRPPARFDASLDELVRDGVVSPVERARIRSLSDENPSVSAHQQACSVGALSQQECSSGLVVRWRGSSTISGPAIKPLSPNEQALLNRIRSNSYTPQWRTYGQCKYDWAGWRLNSNGTRTTASECGGSATRLTVGVSCDRLLVAGYTTSSGWSKWKEPAGPGNKSRQGEDEMVAALCANV